MAEKTEISDKNAIKSLARKDKRIVNYEDNMAFYFNNGGKLTIESSTFLSDENSHGNLRGKIYITYTSRDGAEFGAEIAVRKDGKIKVKPLPVDYEDKYPSELTYNGEEILLKPTGSEILINEAPEIAIIPKTGIRIENTLILMSPLFRCNLRQARFKVV